MIDFLLDTNIVIYLLQKNLKYVRFLEQHAKKNFGMSVVTVIETLVGAQDKSELKAYKAIISDYEIIPLSADIAFDGAETLFNRGGSFKDGKLADILIAHTALFHQVPLVTNNPKDFRRFKGLKIIVP